MCKFLFLAMPQALMGQPATVKRIAQPQAFDSWFRESAARGFEDRSTAAHQQATQPDLEPSKNLPTQWRCRIGVRSGTPVPPFSQQRTPRYTLHDTTAVTEPNAKNRVQSC